MKKLVLSMAIVSITSLFSVPASFGASFRDSKEYSNFIQDLTDDGNASLFGSLMNQMLQTGAACGTAAGIAAGVAVLDTVPLIGLVKNVGSMTGSSARLVKYAGKSLKIHELPAFIKMLETMGGLGGKIATMTPASLKAFLMKAAPTAGVQGAYAERVIGAVLGFHAENPTDLAGAVESIGPHFLGGGISAFVDHGLFRGISRGLAIDRSSLPEGKLTREAYRATVIAAQEGFSENGGCRIAKAKLDAAMEEILMRNGMLNRPSKNEEPNINLTGMEKQRFIATQTGVTREQPHPAARPFGGKDNGGPDFEPRAGRGN